MKIKVLVLLISFFSLGLSAQLKSNDIILSVDGNYITSNYGSGLFTNNKTGTEEHFNLGASLGAFFTNKIMMGIGVDYYWSNQYAFNTINLNSEIQIELMSQNTNVLMSNFFLSFYQNIVGKLYYNTSLRFSYGRPKITTYTESHVVNFPPFTGDGTFVSTPPRYARSSSTDTELECFSTELSPEFNYFFTSRFGLSLQLGGIKYTVTDGNKKDANWIFSFNPSFWQLGFKLKLF